MDSQFEKLIDVNISGRVFAICHSRGVVDPVIIGHYKDILRQAVQANLCEDSTPADFNRVLDEQAVWLESEIGQINPKQTIQQPQKPVETIHSPEEDLREAEHPGPKKQPTGYVPKAKSMPERLADQRADMERLLEKDCVNLKLISPAQATKFKRRLLGQEPKKAEEEVVAELRNIIHLQLRKFIRKHEGGPWATASLQHELRMDIVSTRTLRSLVTLARELLLERDAWLKKNKVSLSGRLFGGRVLFNK